LSLNIDLVRNQDLYSMETILKIVNHDHVLVTNFYYIENIVKFYDQYPLFESSQDHTMYLRGIPIRKEVSSTIKIKIGNM